MISGPILLPDTPGLKTDRPAMMDFGGTLTPPLGGPVQRLLRLGTRHSLTFVMPQMETEPHGRIWSAKLRMAKLYGVLLPFGQDGFNIGAPGAPVVDGAGQSGSTILLKGFTPNYTVMFGQAFSLVHNGKRYLHFAAAQGQVGGDGKVTLDIFPMLRVLPANNAVCEFGKPMIEGSLSGNEVAWDRLTMPWSDFGTITVSEDE
ncbi:hypothetical protein [Sphingomonas immobilis]|uniref:Uncharacterized protein n=1 Tax=Sphingomonas immobilis TaxID=3063997 RepID=A0ABT9A0V2_9SPHN|nr:hypothetical protein [Sphingomonas sp. CA1-15]MDO7843458.1 hypothetical protein [Sphingomonas sp. CA1-15]